MRSETPWYTPAYTFVMYDPEDGGDRRAEIVVDVLAIQHHGEYPPGTEAPTEISDAEVADAVYSALSDAAGGKGFTLTASRKVVSSSEYPPGGVS